MADTPKPAPAGSDLPKRRPATPPSPLPGDAEKLRQDSEPSAYSNPYQTKYGSDTRGHYGSDDSDIDQPEADDRYKPQSNEPIYDEPGVHQPEEGQAAPAGSDRNWRDRLGFGGKRGEDRDKLGKAEKEPAATGAGRASKDSSAIPEAERSLYKPTPEAASKSRFRNLFRTRRRKVIAGGGIAGTIIGLFFGFSVIQGPLQLVHLSQILGKNFSGNEQTSSIRFKGLWRYARTGDIGETRLNKLGSTVYRKALLQLEDVGIKFERNSFGVPKSMTIDPSKYPDYKGLSRAQQKSAIIRDFSINSDKSFVAAIEDPGSGKFTVHLNATSLKGMDFSKALLKTSIGKLGNGRIQSAMQVRYIGRAFGLPRLFSPIDNRIKAGQSKAASAIDAKKARQLEKERLKALQEPQAAKIAGARAKVKNVLKNNQGKITGFLLGTTGLCLVRSIADDAVSVNRGAIVLPATIQAADKVSVGSQVQSGQNFDSTQAGAVADSFIDENGQSIWGAKALQVTAGASNPTGPDLPAEYAQAFSNKTTADNIRKGIEVSIPGTNIDITGAICSDFGLVVQLAVGVGLLVSGVFTAGTSWGAYVAQQTAIAAATAGVIYLLSQQFSNLIEDKAIVPEVLAGPLGGNLLAYSAREMASISVRGSGGVLLSDSESDSIDQQANFAAQQEFNSKSIASKLFDIHDYRSVASKIIDNASPGITQNVAKMGSLFTNFGYAFSSISKLVSPLVHAEPKPYNWGSPRYGIPKSLAEDPKYENSYDNGDVVAQFLDDSSYRDRARKCFGVDINKDSGVWSVVAKEDVNPGSSDYTGTNCDDESENWRRLMLFVHDSRDMDTQACYELNDQIACDNIGFEDSGDSQTSSTTVGPITSLNGQALAAGPQKWIQWIAQNVVPNLPGNADEKAAMAARVTWWSLKEADLDVPNPLSYSNCGDTSSSNNCPDGTLWQVGIAGVQVPSNVTTQYTKDLEAKATSLHSGQAIDQILGQVAQNAGYSQGSSEYSSVVNSTGRARASWLLRDPATGFVTVFPAIEPCLTEQGRAALKAQGNDWCQGYGSAAHVAKDVLTTNAVIAELTSYFQSSGSVTTSAGASIEGDIGLNSDSVACAQGTKDLGVVISRYTGVFKKESGPLKIRLCQVASILGEGNNTDGAEISGGATANSRVSGAWQALGEAAKADGVKLSSFSSFRLADSCGGTGTGGSCATPGNSPHQMGVAIDFAETHIEGESLTSCSLRAEDPGNPAWDWLLENAERFGFEQYTKESWHWDPMPMANRCNSSERAG